MRIITSRKSNKMLFQRIIRILREKKSQSFLNKKVNISERLMIRMKI